MQANYNKILGIQSSKQRAKSKLRSVKNLKSDVSRDRPVSDVWQRPNSSYLHYEAAISAIGYYGFLQTKHVTIIYLLDNFH